MPHTLLYMEVASSAAAGNTPGEIIVHHRTTRKRNFWSRGTTLLQLTMGHTQREGSGGGGDVFCHCTRRMTWCCCRYSPVAVAVTANCSLISERAQRLTPAQHSHSGHALLDRWLAGSPGLCSQWPVVVGRRQCGEWGATDAHTERDTHEY